MFKLLIRLMLLATLYELGISVSEFSSCTSRQCLKKIEARSREILHVDWRPISVFPEEAKRFK